jgi:hypothetical protein
MDFHRLNGTTKGRALPKTVQSPTFSAASKAVSENKPLIAAVNRCATQNQVQHLLFRNQ